jgi:hypothetical protein
MPVEIHWNILVLEADVYSAGIEKAARVIVTPGIPHARCDLQEDISFI